jgi:hypothetical protein
MFYVPKIRLFVFSKETNPLFYGFVMYVMKVQQSLFYRFLFTVFIACSSIAVQAETIVFDMSVFGFKFGEMVLTKSVKNDSTEVYTVNAKGKTDFLWMKREEESIFKVEYRNGKLFSSDYEYLNKGKREKWSSVRFDGSKYMIQSHQGDREFTAPLDYSLIKFYFDPTLDREQIFCEEDCSYAQIERKENTLKVKCQDGSRSTYHVKDGKVESMEIHLDLATVKLTRVS